MLFSNIVTAGMAAAEDVDIFYGYTGTQPVPALYGAGGTGGGIGTVFYIFDPDGNLVYCNTDQRQTNLNNWGVAANGTGANAQGISPNTGFTIGCDRTATPGNYLVFCSLNSFTQPEFGPGDAATQAAWDAYPWAYGQFTVVVPVVPVPSLSAFGLLLNNVPQIQISGH